MLHKVTVQERLVNDNRLTFQPGFENVRKSDCREYSMRELKKPKEPKELKELVSVDALHGYENPLINFIFLLLYWLLAVSAAKLCEPIVSGCCTFPFPFEVHRISIPLCTSP